MIFKKQKIKFPQSWFSALKKKFLTFTFYFITEMFDIHILFYDCGDLAVESNATEDTLRPATKLKV